jgi:ceramide glucosyltransferase
MNLLGVFSAGCIAVSLTYYGFTIVLALRFAKRRSSPPPSLPRIAPRVAILKPLHGVSETLPENLLSYLELDYRRIEYLFGVSDYGDPAAGLIAGLKAQHPLVQSTLVIGEEPGCSNRKVAKLIRMAERVSQAEVILLSDADVSVERNHLRQLVGELYSEADAGLVTCLYRGKPVGTLASRFEALFINTDFVPMILAAHALEPFTYALGATIVVKREALEAIGGFRGLKDLLADDYYLGKFVSDCGYRIKLSSSLVTVRNNEQHLAEFWKHQLRWARTYRTNRPVSLATIILHGPFWGVVLLATSRCSLTALALFAGVVAARIAMSRVLIGKVLGLADQRYDAWLVPLKDLMMTGVWAASLFSKRVLWAGRRLKIHRDGTMREVFD